MRGRRERGVRGAEGFGAREKVCGEGGVGGGVESGGVEEVRVRCCYERGCHDVCRAGARGGGWGETRRAQLGLAEARVRLAWRDCTDRVGWDTVNHSCQ